MPDPKSVLIRPLSLFCVLVCLAASAGSAGGSGDSFSGLPVAAIHFERRFKGPGKGPKPQPAQGVPASRDGEAAQEERFREALTVQVNQPYHPDKIRESIARLYATGRFAEIEVEAGQRPDGLVLTFITQENYFVGGVRVEGAREPPTERQLANVTKLELGELYTEEKIQRAVAALRHLLEVNGYHNASIDPQVEPRPDSQEVDIRFVVETGKRARIEEVEIQGNPGFPPQKLVEQARLKTGKPATAQRFQNALVRLRRFYQDHEQLAARVELAERRYRPATNGELVVLRAVAGPRVAVEVLGGGVSLRTLRALLPVYEEGAVEPELVREGARNLQDYFQGRGFFEAQVKESREEDPQTGSIRVQYQVEKGRRHTLDRVEIRGNRFFDEAILREHLAASTGAGLGGGRFSRSLLDQDLAGIRELYQANGFHSAQVNVQVDDDYRGKTGLVHVRLDVAEGPQALVRRLNINGNRQISQQELFEVIAQLEGQPFSDYNAGLDRDNILAYYFDHGFPSANFQWKATPVGDGAGVDLEYTIIEGERQYVSRVLVAGQEYTRLAVVERQVELQEGEPLAQSNLLQTQRNLYELGIFNRVGMAVENPEGNETRRNVLLQVEEARRWTMAVGVGAEIARIGGGLNSLESPEGAAGFSPRVSLDVTRLNFRGLNHTLSFKSQFSTQQQRAVISYTAPRFWNAPNWTFFINGFEDRTSDVRTFTALRLEGSVSLAEKRSKSDTVIYRFSYRRVQVEQATLKITPGLIPLLSRPVRVGIPSVTFIRDRRDNPANSHKGVYLTVDYGLSAGQVGSEANFNRLLAQFTTYHSFGKNLVLARTTQFGLQEPFGGLRSVVLPQAGGPPVITFTREIPLPERFFSGGGNSHRGFSVNQAGPRDLDTGFPVGGNGLLLNSLELRFPVRRPNFGAVLFHDAGNVYTRLGDISFRTSQHGVTDFNYMVHAVGAGVRYQTPLGPMRLDFAWSINPPAFYGLHGSEQDLLRGTAPRDLRRLSRFQFFFSIGQTY